MREPLLTIGQLARGVSAAAPLVLLLGIAPVAAQDPPAAPAALVEAPSVVWSRDADGHVTLRAVRIQQPLVLDGRLDEPVYRTTPAISRFVQQEPHEGEASTEPTDVWLFFDNDNIYVSVRCAYSEGGHIVANEMRRDHSNIRQNDHFTVTLDTFHDHRSGYFFQTNALGALREMQVADERTTVVEWNTVWDVHAQIVEQTWTAEFSIPFKSLRYDAGTSPQTWGINLRRITTWNSEVSFVTLVPQSYGVGGVSMFSKAATLIGIEVPAQSRNLELKPYGIAAIAGARSADRLHHDATSDAGFDVKYGLTRGLTADFTYNTDFAQVEEDDQQVNLTRFSLFVPEKREFFLEGQGIFEFGRTGQAGTPNMVNLTPDLFFSRRIGFSNDRAVPIRAGGRVTGRVGRYSLGAVTVHTQEDQAARAVPTDFTVARLRRDILRRSTIGVIATHRTPTASGDGTNQVVGADAALAFFENVFVTSYYARSRTPGETRDESSYLGQLSYGADRYGLTLAQLSVGEGFNPEIGFLRRSAFRRTYGQGRFSPRPRRNTRVRKYSFEASLDYITDPRNVLESREAQGTFGVAFNNGDQVSSEVTRSYELLREPFDIARGVRIAPGGYDFQELRARYTLGPQRRMTGTVTLAHGTFYDGDRTETSYDGRVEFDPRLSVEPRVSVNRVALAHGDFTTTLVSTRTIFTMTPRAALSGLVQYNSRNSTLSSSLRLRWEYRPGSELFVVYADGRDTSRSGFPVLQGRTFAIKLTRLFRY